MGDHPNVAAVREMIEAFEARDLERARDLLAPDLKWHMIGGATVEGLEALESAMSAMDDQFHIEAAIHDVVGNDEHVIALINATARVGDREFSYRTAEIMHVTDGVITERWAFSDDTDAINQFFGQFS